MYSILIQPLLSERMTSLEKQRQYAFEVNIKSNKIEIAKAVEKKFNVKVSSVRTMIYEGKSKSMMTRKGVFSGKKSDWKKAIVTLKDGFSINLLENV
mgnify:CR=1 FL=1